MPQIAFKIFLKIIFSVKIFMLEPLANPSGQSKEYGYNGYNNTIFFQPILKEIDGIYAYEKSWIGSKCSRQEKNI